MSCLLKLPLKCLCLVFLFRVSIVVAQSGDEVTIEESQVVTRFFAVICWSPIRSVHFHYITGDFLWGGRFHNRRVWWLLLLWGWQCSIPTFTIWKQKPMLKNIQRSRLKNGSFNVQNHFLILRTPGVRIRVRNNRRNNNGRHSSHKPDF